ncbi:substrate-binding domain-containing protein [Paenirhodobacter enshiensis]|uniref:substrate-binding domain-containing protein n=1 Tax=Paenirhodobacter enshiensis TaxID=1105367 RepID=UPI0035B35457
MDHIKLGLSALAIAAISAPAAFARDQIQTAGSSTVLPYATIVAEAFGENFKFPTPVVESGGSGAGRKKLCEGVGENTIDIANSSSRITQADIDTCKSNGVNEIMEVRFGYDGIVFASEIKGPEFAFTPADIYGALASNVAKDGKIVPNTAKTWKDVKAGFPAQNILMFIPGTKHGTREVFDTKVIEAGCKASGAYDLFKAASKGADDKAKEKDAVSACNDLRKDGASVEIDGDYTETLARIAANKDGIGVFGLSFYQNNTDKLRVATVNGITPSVETVAKGEYPVSRPLYFYVKKAHIGVVPGLQEYIDFFVSDDIAGPNGPLAQYGLVPDPELAKTQEMVKNDVAMGPLK